MQPAARLYRPHIEALSARYDAALESTGFDAVLIGAGVPVPVHRDDQDYPYRPEPLFLQWAAAAGPSRARRCSIARAASHCCWCSSPRTSGTRRRRFRRVPGRRRSTSASCAGADEIAQAPAGSKTRQAAWHCSAIPSQWRGLSLPGTPNPKALLTHLDYDRAFKTPWEVACMQVATAMGLAGHRAVRQAFAAGCSEYEMGLMFLAACRPDRPGTALPGHRRDEPQRRDAALPAPGPAPPARPRERHSLLLDAGCDYAGYASDITRTYAARRGEFASMVRDMDRAQQRLCALVRPGVAFPELQLAAHGEIAALLARWDLVRMTPEDMVSQRVTRLPSCPTASATSSACRCTTWAAASRPTGAASSRGRSAFRGCASPARWSRAWS